MSKGKSITLLTIISVLMTFVLVMTFVRFPVGNKNYNSALGAIQLDYDIDGGISYTLSISKENDEEVENVDEVVSKLEERLESLGYSIYSVKALKSTDEAVEDSDIRIEIRNSQNAQKDIETVAKYGTVKFYGGKDKDPSTEILKEFNVIKSAKYLGQMKENDHIVAIEFFEDAHEELLKKIKAEDDYNLKITCGEDSDGNEIPLFSGHISEESFDKNTLGLTGIPTAEQAKRTALQMRDGGLNYRYEISEGAEISSPYGENIAIKCAVAVITLVLVIMILFFVLYRGLGIVASLSMLLFILGETWLMIGVPGIVMSIGGVIGIISATILCGVVITMIMQRVKDEYADSQKTVKAAISKGFMSALVPTIGAHVVAGAVALLLLAFTSGVVRGFAITFGIGAGVSLIATLLITRMFTALILPLVKNPEKFLRFKRNEGVAEVSEEVEA